MSWAFVQKVSPPMCSALMCRQQRRTAPTYSGLSFECCACPTQAPNAVSSALSSSRWVFSSPSPASEPRIAWLLNCSLNWYVQSHRREESACCNPGFFHHMQWYSHLSFLLQCGAALFPLGRGAPYQWSSSDPSVTSYVGPLTILFLWLL